MSIYRPQELRYAKLDSVKQERALMNNYWNDIIRIHGYDVTYYRKDTKYAKSGEIDSESIYGWKDDPTYSTKTGLRAFVDISDYNFILDGTGFVPSDKVTIYFGINDFACSFVPELGRFQSFAVSAVSGYATKKRNSISVPFSSEVMRGNAVVPIDVPERKTGVPAEIEDASVPCYSVAFNPYIRRSFSTDYRDGYYSANVMVDYDASSGSNRVKYLVHGDVLYSNFFENERVISEIHPNPGDVVEIDYHTEDGVKEQYEITEVISRKPTNTEGLSPFVGKYVYRCAAVRRISSEMDPLAPEIGSREAKDAHMDYSEERARGIDSSSTDWSSPSADHASDYYGGYSKADGFKSVTETPSGNAIQEIFDYAQWKKDWPGCGTSSGFRTIADFSDGTTLFTDGINLYWGEPSEREDATMVTSIPPSSVAVDPEHLPDMMYLCVRDGQVSFVTADNCTVETLTDFANPLDCGFEYPDGFTYRDVGYVSNSGYYVFKNSRVAVNSFGGERLVAFSDGGNEPSLIAVRTRG